MAEEMDYLRQLIDESYHQPDAKPGFEMRSMNPWSYRAKPPERIEADQRAAYVLGRLAEKYPRAHASLPNELAQQVDAYQKDPTPWTSAYEPTSGSHPLYNAAKWAQSLPAAIYATGKMVGNEVHRATAAAEHEAKHVPYPEAYKDYEYATNTLTGNATEAAGVLPKGSYWDDVVNVAETQKRAPQVGFMPSHSLDGIVANALHGQMPVLEEGKDYLTKSGVNPTVATFWGPVMDSALNFPSSIGPAINSLRAGKAGAALGELAMDYGLSTPHIWLPAIERVVNDYKQGKLPYEDEWQNQKK